MSAEDQEPAFGVEDEASIEIRRAQPTRVEGERERNAARAYLTRTSDQVDRARHALGQLIDELEDAVAIGSALAGDSSADAETERALARARRLLSELAAEG